MGDPTHGPPSTVASRFLDELLLSVTGPLFAAASCDRMEELGADGAALVLVLGEDEARFVVGRGPTYERVWESRHLVLLVVPRVVARRAIGRRCAECGAGFYARYGHRLAPGSYVLHVDVFGLPVAHPTTTVISARRGR